MPVSKKKKKKEKEKDKKGSRVPEQFLATSQKYSLTLLLKRVG